MNLGLYRPFIRGIGVIRGSKKYLEFPRNLAPDYLQYTKTARCDSSRREIKDAQKQIRMSHQIQTYTELQKQIHDDLRIQHPEWVQPNGESPMCDSYESRLAELFQNFTRTGSDESIAAVHRMLEQASN